MYGVIGVGRGGWVMYVGLGWDGKGLVVLRKGGVIVVVNGCWWWCDVECGFQVVW